MDLDQEIEIKKPKFIKFLEEKKKMSYIAMYFVSFFVPGFIITILGSGITVGYILYQTTISTVWAFGFSRFLFRKEYGEWREENGLE